MTPLDYAKRYAELGLRVVPIPPGGKYPTGLGRWQEWATTDGDVLWAWWQDRPDDGVGLALGRLGTTSAMATSDNRWVFAVDIDGAGHGADGEAMWQVLCEEHDQPPDTWEQITGGGGRHLLYAAPFQVTNANLLPQGIDVRGAGGQIVVEPSVHPSGGAYAWVDGQEPWSIPIADAPAWLLDYVRAPEPVPSVRVSPNTERDGEERAPGDLWAEAYTWAQLLECDGWTLHHTDRDGEQHWTRPGKERRGGTSATVGYGGSDVLKVFTSSVPDLVAEETYTRFGYLAATRFDGDHTAAARWCREQGYKVDRPAPDATELGLVGIGSTVAGKDRASDDEPVDELEDWRAYDLAGHASRKIGRPQPTLLAVGEGQALLYPGRVNGLFGESGGGKTWVTLAALQQAVAAGLPVLVIDFEDSVHGFVPRLLNMGVPADALGLITYLAPETGGAREPVMAYLTELITDRRIGLVIIDSTGEALAMSGVKGNDDDDVARWFRYFPRRLANLGPSVLLVDHVPKDPNAPQLYQIGSQRKRAAINGASYRVDVIKAPARGKDGTLKLVVAKDRHGTRSHGSTAALVHIDEAEPPLKVFLTEPEIKDPDAPFRPTALMERVSRWLELNPWSTGRQIKDSVTGKNDYIDVARERLAEEGHLESRPGPHNATEWHALKPYREQDETVAGLRVIPVIPSDPRVIPGITPDASEMSDPRDPPAYVLHAGDGDHSTSQDATESEPVIPDELDPFEALR